ncbi:MAG: type IV toxin-antitoxin system AbiEi family antitoxin domain-containing protein [Longimicrobiales bacterium]
MPHRTDRQRILRLARGRGVLSSRVAHQAGVHSQALSRMVQEGTLERIARGQYRVVDALVSEHHGLAVAAAAVPHGVVCLLSALSFHGIGTQLPGAIWMAIDRRARRPALVYPPLHIVRVTGKALTEGIETHSIEGQGVRVYGVAKTVADAFKYRNKIGLEVALEALREAWRERRTTMDEIDHFARICRVERVMGPYVEALVA